MEKSKISVGSLIDRVLSQKKRYLQCLTQERKNNKRNVLVVGTGEITASYMSFTEYSGEDFSFFYTDYNELEAFSLLIMDYVIQVRGLPDHNWLKVLCKNVNIPIFYYTDDNFREIFRNDQSVLEYRNTNRDYLADFNGIIVSTQELKKYFLDNYLHDTILYLPPVLSQRVTSSKNKSGRISIGYLGGAFRHSIFLHIVLPAMLKIAEEYDIQLILPDDKELVESLTDISRIRVVWYSRKNDYIGLLNEINNFGVDILVHPGEDAPNNRFKTKNSLANATLLGAVLIASNVAPFNIQDDFFDKYLICENDVQKWYEAIRWIITNENLVREIKSDAEEIIRHEYESENAWRDLTKKMLDIPSSGGLEKRLEEITRHYLNHRNRNKIMKRRLNPDSVTCQMIRRKRRYRVTPHKEEFDTITFAFARFGNCSGYIEITILNQKGIVLGESVIDVCSITRDNITTCQLDNKIETVGQDLLIEINPHYENISGGCGVFENKINRSFFYRCFNKIGLTQYGRNVLWIDIY